MSEEATETKRTNMVYDTLEICSYLKMANVFTSEVYVKRRERYLLLDKIGVAKVDSKNKLFILNRPLDPDVFQGKISFKIKLESSHIEFASSMLPVAEGDEAQMFMLPRQMMVQYVRSFLRVEPSKEHPIETKFNVNRLSVKFRLIDISTGGMAVSVPNVELLLDVGDVIEDMVIMLTDQEHIEVTGQVRFIKEERCNIKFVDISPRAEGVIAEYIERRKLADIVREKLFMDVEGELMKFDELEEVDDLSPSAESENQISNIE